MSYSKYQSVDELWGTQICLWRGPARRGETPDNQADVLLDLFFAEIVTAPSLLNKKGDLFPKMEDLKARSAVQISVIQLPKYKIGGLYRNGTKIGQYSGEKKIFKNVQIIPNADNIFKFKPKEYLKNSEFRIPSEQFLVHPNADDSNLVHFESQDNEGKSYDVLIPCWEVIRYFFGGSSKFIRELHTGGLEGFNNIYDPGSSGFDNKTGIAHIDLRLRMKDNDKILAARMVSDEYYLKVAKSIAPNLIGLNDVNGSHPLCRIPYIGAFDIECRGLSLKTVAGKDVFLVLQIIDESMTSPVKELIWNRKNDSRRGKNFKDIGLKECWKNIQKEMGKLTAEQRSTVHSPLGKRNVNPIEEEVEGYFSPFSKKRDTKVTRSEKEIQKFKSAKYSEKSSEISENLTTNPDESNNGITDRVEFNDKKLPKKPRIVFESTQVFMELQRRFLQESLMSCKWLHFSLYEDEKEFPYSDFPEQDKSSTWLLKNTRCGKRRRRFLLFHLHSIKLEKHFYFFDIEPFYKIQSFRINMVYCDKGNLEISDEDLLQVSDKCVKVKGIWSDLKPSHYPHGFESRRFNHQSSKKVIKKKKTENKSGNEPELETEEVEVEKIELTFQQVVELNFEKMRSFIQRLENSKNKEPNSS
jgi:hypothetical protein